MSRTVGFLGCGMMGEAMATGMIEKGFVSAATDLHVYDPYAPQMEKLKAGLGLNTYSSNLEVVQKADIIILAVKPNVIAAALNEVRPALSAKHTIVSIAAGVTLDTLAEHSMAASNGARLIRVMPNTPCMVGMSASAFCKGVNATADDAATIKTMLESVGLCFEVEEKLLDAVTGLSGSGPAYVYLFIEALADGGVRAGLPRPIAQALAAQTVKGAAEMVLSTGKHPGQLKDAVCSPGGTTIEGVTALENGGLRGTCINAVSAAATKSTALGKK